MMDYYSNFTAPAVENAKKIFKQSTLHSNENYQNNKHLINEQEFDHLIDEAFLGVIENGAIKYSLTGWNVFGRKEVLAKYNKDLLNLVTQKKLKMKRKVVGLLKCTYLLLKSHNATIKRLYQPDSNYVQNVLKKEFEEMADGDLV